MSKDPYLLRLASSNLNGKGSSSIHSRLEPWSNTLNKAQLLGDSYPHMTKEVSRTPALDLAQQAQIAACNYLGYNPHEFSNFRQQAPAFDSSRPLELHMHHHHHHYVASPKSPFSQSSSQYLEGPTNEVPATAANNKLSIRVASPVPESTTSTSSTTATYPALGLHGSSVGPQGSSPSRATNGTTTNGHVDVSQRYLQNVLWLKNEIEDDPDHRLRNGQEQKGAGSPRSAPLLQSIATSQRQPIGQTSRFLRTGDQQYAQMIGRSEDDVCSEASKSRVAAGSPSNLERFKSKRSFCGYHSPYNSLSGNNSVVGESTPALRVAFNNSNRSPRFEVKSPRPNIITCTNGRTSGSIDTPVLQMQNYQDTVRCPSRSKPGVRELKFHSSDGNNCDDTASSLEDDSFCNSEMISDGKGAFVWPYNSICSGKGGQPTDLSPAGRAARRVLRRHGPRGTRAWVTKRSYETDWSHDEREKSICVYDLDSEAKTVAKQSKQVVGNRRRYVPEYRPCAQDRFKEDKDRGDSDNLRVHGSKRQTICVPENVEISWISRSGLQPVLDSQVKLNLESRLDEGPCTASFFDPGMDKNKYGNLAPHNRLREAVEAAWKTNLGTLRGFKDYDAKTEPTNQDNLNTLVLRQQQNQPGGLLYKMGALREEAEEGWKSMLETKKGFEDSHQGKSPSDPIFRDMHRDHENLKSLVAREESLQRELKDQTVARVAAEETARIAAEQKANIFEASAKVAEEGLRVLLEEKALFHTKFQVELQQGATDKLRLQELLQLEKFKLEATEGELREVRRSFQDSLTVGTRASKNSPHDLSLDILSTHPPAIHGAGVIHDDAGLKLMAESESRIAAEAKATYFEASAKAAEEQLRNLLDERNSFYGRFKEELEQTNTDMINLQGLMDLEKANYEGPEVLQRKKVDVRSLVASSIVKESFENNTEEDQGALQIAVHDRESSHSKLQDELLYNDPEGHELGPSMALTDSHHENLLEGKRGITMGPTESFRNGSVNAEISEFKKAQEEIEGDTFHTMFTHGCASIKNEKEKALSPPNITRPQHWNQPDTSIAVKFEQCRVGGGEVTTFLDISPENGRLKSVDVEIEGNSQIHRECCLPRAESAGVKGVVFNVSKSLNLSVKTSPDSSDTDGCPSLLLQAKWQKETIAELRRMIQEQESTWKIAEDAVEELGRRLELLERYKMVIEDVLGRSGAIGNMNCFLKRLDEKLEDFPRDFNTLYISPIYERASAACANHFPQEFPHRPYASKDYEIQQLRAEISQLEDEVQRRKMDFSTKSDFQVFPRSPPSPIVLSESMVPGDLHLVHHSSVAYHASHENTGREIEQDLPDDPFEEMETVATKLTRNGQSSSSQKRKDRHFDSQSKVDNLDDSEDFCPWIDELKVGNRVQVPIPNKGNGENFTSPSGASCIIPNPQQRNCINGYEQDVDFVGSENLNSDEGDVLLLKSTVRKLSRIFWEQEGKLKKFKSAPNDSVATSSQSTDLRDFYLDLLMEMSQQLGELCHDLQENNRFYQKIDQKFHQVDIIEQQPVGATELDSLGAPLEAALHQVGKSTPKLLLIENPDFGVEQLYSGIENQTEDATVESASVMTAPKASNVTRKSEEEMITNLFLESGAQYLSRVIEEHAEEGERKDHSMNRDEQLTLHLASDMAQTEASLAEVRSRYKSLVATLESQLDAARSELTSLQDTMNDMKVEMERKDLSVSKQEGKQEENEFQIQELKEQIQACQGETHAAILEKVELTNSLQAMEKEADEQHHNIAELVSINEDLIAFSQSKEDEIRVMTKNIKRLQQSVDEKTDEATKLSGTVENLSQEVIQARKGENYRLRCMYLKSKLEETQHELIAREGSMERLTHHLVKTIEGQDLILEEKEQLLQSLSKAQYKEHRTDDQLRQSKIIIQDMEEKLNSLDAEIVTARLEIGNLKAKGQEALAFEKQAGEMRNRVHQLEEEIMEKDGQISILKTSCPGEYSSTF